MRDMTQEKMVVLQRVSHVAAKPMNQRLQT